MTNKKMYCIYKDTSGEFQASNCTIESDAVQKFENNILFNDEFGSSISLQLIVQANCVYIYEVDKKNNLMLHKLTKSLFKTVKYNKYRLTQNANMLYIEIPYGVGFSYTTS